MLSYCIQTGQPDKNVNNELVRPAKWHLADPMGATGSVSPETRNSIIYRNVIVYVSEVPSHDFLRTKFLLFVTNP